jgi:hypothetical protein
MRKDYFILEDPSQDKQETAPPAISCDGPRDGLGLLQGTHFELSELQISQSRSQDARTDSERLGWVCLRTRSTRFNRAVIVNLERLPPQASTCLQLHVMEEVQRMD